MTRKITSTMVAKAAGVAQSTVSLVLNNSPKVAVETQRAVLDAARALGYPLIPQNNRRFIGIILSREISSASYQTMCLEALKQVISERGFRMELVCSEDIPLLNERAICGAIAISGIPSINQEWAQYKTIPLVRIASCGNHRNNIYSVYNDVEANLGLALEHLRALGHRRIGLLLGWSRSHECLLREKYGEVFLRQLSKYGTETPELLLAYEDENELIEHSLQKLLEQNITSLIIIPGDTALKVGAQLRKKGIKIPEQLSLITREYPGVTEFWDPPLTALLPDYKELASQAINILEKLINREKNVCDVMVPGVLIKRASVAQMIRE